LKARAQLKEIVDLSKFNGNEERYVIPMQERVFGLKSGMSGTLKEFLQAWS
jgi:hypothetical protein